MKPSHNILSFGINGSLRRREEQSPNSYTEHYLFNSSANLKAYSYDKTDFAYYGYNAANTRAYKLGLSGSSQWVNGQQQSLHLGPQQAMFYPNAYINFNQNGEYTKHYYNGAERIASRLGDNQQTIEAEANDRLLSRIAQTDELFKAQISEMAAYEEPAVNVPARGNGEGTRNLLFPTVGYDPIPAFTALQPTGNTSDIFYYHTNHLGSTAFVTDQNQTVTQGFLYAPFGEITTEYNATFGNDIIPKYSFNAKELDEETGMYYYEARYYKPPVFTSRDPMFEKYFWMTPYAYCANNPVKYVDPSGEDPIYTKNFWGRVVLVGDDGKCSTGSYLVSGTVARNVKKATKAGLFYTGDLSESKNVMHIPTGQILKDVQQTVTATINSGPSPEKRVENGGHTLKGDKTARIWDAGSAMYEEELSDGTTMQTWSITPFKIGGKNNQIGGETSDIQFFWHIHPSGYVPSDNDYWWINNLRENGFMGNTFLIDVNSNRVTFYDEKGILLYISYDDFIRMGNQE